jgi:crotonobetainyl-CoA:carnitine CoA-transferase CaiB-like acyl-CoA transferase
MKPMEGMRVVDLSHVIAAPTCGHYPAHYGADVIKVEPPGTGDVLRTGHGRAQVDEGVTVGFAAINAGKRSIVLDLKTPRAWPRCSRWCARPTCSSRTSVRAWSSGSGSATTRCVR